MLEYGILMPGGDIIVGPRWRGPDEVIDTFHGFGVTRVYGQLVTRINDSDWRAV